MKSKVMNRDVTNSRAYPASITERLIRLHHHSSALRQAMLYRYGKTKQELKPTVRAFKETITECRDLRELLVRGEAENIIADVDASKPWDVAGLGDAEVAPYTEGEVRLLEGLLVDAKLLLPGSEDPVQAIQSIRRPIEISCEGQGENVVESMRRAKAERAAEKAGLAARKTERAARRAERAARCRPAFCRRCVLVGRAAGHRPCDRPLKEKCVWWKDADVLATVHGKLHGGMRSSWLAQEVMLDDL